MIEPLVGTALALSATTADAQSSPVPNIVLVHGAFADGSGWRGVYDELTAEGYKVGIVQNPLTSFAEMWPPRAASSPGRTVRRFWSAIPIYGGTVITDAGDDAKVAGLVYVAAFAPEVGQSVSLARALHGLFSEAEILGAILA